MENLSLSEGRLGFNFPLYFEAIQCYGNCTCWVISRSTFSPICWYSQCTFVLNSRSTSCLHCQIGVSEKKYVCAKSRNVIFSSSIPQPKLIPSPHQKLGRRVGYFPVRGFLFLLGGDGGGYFCCSGVVASFVVVVGVIVDDVVCVYLSAFVSLSVCPCLSVLPLFFCVLFPLSLFVCFVPL